MLAILKNYLCNKVLLTFACMRVTILKSHDMVARVFLHNLRRVKTLFATVLKIKKSRKKL